MSGVSLFDVLYRTGTLITTESIPASTVNTGRLCTFIHIFTFIYPCVQAKSAKQNIFLTTCHRKRWSRVAEVSARSFTKRHTVQYQCSRSSTLLLQFLQSKENKTYEIGPIPRQDQQTLVQQKKSGVKYKCWLFVIAQLILLLTTQSWTPKSMQSCQKIDVQCQPEAAARQTAKQASQAPTEMLRKLCHQFY